MLDPDQKTLLKVVEDIDGCKILQHDGHAVPPDLCHQSKTLRALLDTEGEVPLPLSSSHFKAWLAFASAAASNTTEALPDGTRFSNLVTVVEVSLFMQNEAIAADAVSRAVTLLRRAFRQDLLNSHICSDTITDLFPAAMPVSTGPRTRALLSACTRPAPAVAAAAIVCHLTLCEALLLPAPFPAEALTHFLSLTDGVLDLSPPRVPAHTPAALFSITSTLAPLLSAAPPALALRIPAPCLTSLQPVEPLLPHLNTLTSLSITHGKVTYSELETPGALSPHIVAAVLEHLSPATLRHLAIDPLCDPNANPVHRLLCGFTALTSIRLSNLPLALRHMSALASLTVTHLTLPDSGRSADASTGAEPVEHSLRAAPSLKHVHVSGSDEAVCGVYEDFASHTPGKEIPPGSRATWPGRPDAIMSLWGRPIDVHCCGFPVVPGGVSLHARQGWPTNVASSCSHALNYSVVHDAWAEEVIDLRNPTAVSKPRAVADGTHAGMAKGVPASLTSLALQTPWHDPSVFGVAREVLEGNVAHQLRDLWVGCMMDVPPHSVLDAANNPEEDDRGAHTSNGARLDSDPHGSRWVTARPAGVAHPLCALEMLHYNAAPHGDDGAVGEQTAPPGGLHTLHMSRDFFVDLQDLAEEPAPSFMHLRDLAVLKFDLQMLNVNRPDFSCLSRLTNLHTLSLQGLEGVCSAPRRIHFPPGLTALLLHGVDTFGADPAGFGALLLPLRQLQCLDIDVWVGGDLPSSQQAPRRSEPNPLLALRWAFWEGLRPALLELPLRLGVSVSFDADVYSEHDAD